MTLDELAIQFGTDKSSKHNNYTAIYQELLGARREAVTAVCEIGVLKGASIRMWQAWFPAAQIIGVDRWKGWEGEVPARVTLYQHDQTDAGGLRALLAPYAPFDLIVDDALHDVRLWGRCLCTLFSLLKPGGLYVVEDLRAPRMFKDLLFTQWQREFIGELAMTHVLERWPLNIQEIIIRDQLLIVRRDLT